MILAIASGKGGTGKTLVATSLALSLKESQCVTLLDCDVEEPDDNLFIRVGITGSEPVNNPVPFVDESKCTHCGKCAEVCAYNAMAVLGEHVLIFAEICHGCGACTYFCPERAISEQPRRTGIVEWGNKDGLDFVMGTLDIGEANGAPPVIRQVKRHAVNGGLVIIDAPPGTSCPVVEAVKASDFCLLVTEPTPFGLNDVKLAVKTVRQLGILCGVIINRDGAGDSSVEEYCRHEAIPVLLSIPLDTEIARLYSRGITLVEGMPEWKVQFRQLYNAIEEMLNAGNRPPQR